MGRDLQAAFASVILLALSAPCAPAQRPSTPAQELEEKGGQVIRPKPGTQIIGQGTALPVFRAPSAVTVVSGDDLRNSGARMLTDALRQVPGLEMQRVSASESNISMRGYNDASDSAQGILGLLDGRQVYNDFLGNVLWDTLPVDLDDIQQVEVVRGPGSFLYGPNAMHGLVNIVTRSPLQYEGDFTALRTSVGSYHAARAHLTDVRREGPHGFKTTLNWDSSDEFENSGYSARDSIAGELRYALMTGDKDSGVLDLTAGASQQDFGLLIELEGSPSRLRNHGTELYAKAAWQDKDLRAQLAWTGFDSRSEPDVLVQPFTLDLDTVDLDLQYAAMREDGHELMVGAGYRLSTFRTSNVDVAAGRHAANLGWLFAQERYTVGTDLELFAGVRCDYHSVTGTTLSPRVALVWQFDKVTAESEDEPDKGQSLRASYGEGFRNPSMRELWFDMPVAGTPITVLGNRDLEPEHMRSFELAYTGEPASGWKASLSTFYNFVYDLIDFRTQGTAMQPQNSNDEETYGLEVTGEYGVSRSVSVFGNYAHSSRARGGERNSLAPRHKVNAGARWSSGGPRLGQTGMLWVHFFDDTELYGTQLPQYTLLNAHLEHRFAVRGGVGKVFIDGFNLLNDRHREHPNGDRYGMMVSVGLGIEW